MEAPGVYIIIELNCFKYCHGCVYLIIFLIYYFTSRLGLHCNGVTSKSNVPKEAALETDFKMDGENRIILNVGGIR